MDLYESGQCDLLCTDQYGMTALHHAARFGHKHIVKFLIKHGRGGGSLGIVLKQITQKWCCFKSLASDVLMAKYQFLFAVDIYCSVNILQLP